MTESSKKPAESLVLSRCLTLLANWRVFGWRNNTGSYKAEGRFIRYGHPGSSDILAVLDDRFRDPITGRNLAGVMLCVECKRKGGKQSSDQRLFEQCVTKRGAIYLLVFSEDELAKWLARAAAP